jgi:hypothetical protein
MTGTGVTPGATYEVAIPGLFNPSFLAAFAAMGVGWTDASSTFLLPLTRPLAGVSEIAEMLHARELLILRIRRVSGAVDDTE